MDTALEKTELQLGILPLVDAVPLVVALEKGYFRRQGLEVLLSLESSWASVRDKVALGLLDAAQMPAPMPIAASLGIDGVQVPMLTALSLNLNGNGITLSAELHRRLTPYLSGPISATGYARALRQLLDQDRIVDQPRPTFAHVFPFSKHHYELRLWLASAGIACDTDVNLTVVPPQRVVDRLEAGAIDGFCVGAPWSEVARQRGSGHIVATSFELWNNGPEKVLGVTQDWARRHPATHRALVSALIQTARWLETTENREEAGRLMVELSYVDAPQDAVMRALKLEPGQNPLLAGGLVFHAGAANFPWRSHANWFVEQMRASGQLPAAQDVRVALESTYRCDLYREAADAVGEPYPTVDDKIENCHDSLWRLADANGEISAGPDRRLQAAPENMA